MIGYILPFLTRPASPTAFTSRRGQAATVGDFSRGGRRPKAFTAFSIEPIEKTGQGNPMSSPKKTTPPAKPATSRTVWIPAINNHGRFGRWAFVEVTDPWDAKNTIRAVLISEALLMGKTYDT